MLSICRSTYSCKVICWNNRFPTSRHYFLISRLALLSIAPILFMLLYVWKRTLKWLVKKSAFENFWLWMLKASIYATNGASNAALNRMVSWIKQDLFIGKLIKMELFPCIVVHKAIQICPFFMETQRCFGW